MFSLEDIIRIEGEEYAELSSKEPNSARTQYQYDLLQYLEELYKIYMQEEDDLK